VYFDSVGMFVFFLLTGRYLEMRARHRAGDVTDALARLAPACADRVRADGALARIGAIELLPGDRVHVAEGAAVPADGVLESDACRVDEALLTGESEPVAKRRGDALVAGSVVVEGPARVVVERVGADTVLAGIVALTARAQSERPRLAAAGERAAARFVARVLALTALTALGWSLVDPSRAFTASLAVLVVSCPCAFALAVPAAVTRALAVLAQRGVLVVRPDAIETLAGATHVVFDKTGTLTDAAPTLQRIEPRAGLDADAALALAAALARGSRHPLAQAIAGAAAHLPLRHANDVAARAGLGLEGVVDGRRLRLGRPDFALAGTAETCLDARADAVVLADASGTLAMLHFAEHPRADAAAAVATLRAQGLELEILSGDAPAKVEALAATLGIARWHARQRPQDKLARLEALRRGGARVVMVGDGVNDAPVLAGADVAVSFGHGAELAQAHSDVVLGGEQLAALPAARRLAQQTLRVLQQNQRWAAAYNFAVVPVAALGFVPPWLAAIGMSASSLLVILNALRIGRRDDDTHAGEAKA
ncbi:MAG TPA: heavy metal translocating P-type ATPase, partial [Mizugakiibacter sp.]